MRRALILLPLLFLTPAPAARLSVPADLYRLKTVKYADLCRTVRDHAGKVVVVDIWASWCRPCKAEMPHLVALHRKYASQGLVCITVSVDKAEAADAASEFLQRVEARLLNYRLDERPELWTAKLGLKSIPAVFVFDRDGRRAAKLTGDDEAGFTYDRDVVPLVRRLLDQKPRGG